MSLVYYHSPMSAAERTTWAIEEMDVPCERHVLEIRDKREARTPEFLKLNPNGKVPLLVVDGRPIFESAAILIYLGEMYGVDKGLYPPLGVDRAECLKWIVWATVSLVEPLNRFLSNTATTVPGELRNAKAGAVARVEVEAMLALLDHELASRSYLVGDRFSLADLAVAGIVPYLAFVHYEIASHTNVVAWAERCLSRPALKRARQA